MVQIKEFIVVEPPTGGEVRDRVIEGLKSRASLLLTIIGTQEVPKPEPEQVDIDVLQTYQLKDGGMRFIGRTATMDTISVTTQGDETQPAVGDLIV